MGSTAVGLDALGIKERASVQSHVFGKEANLLSLSYISKPRVQGFPCSAILAIALGWTNCSTSRGAMPCSMSDFMSPDRAARSGARARGGLNDRRVTTSKTWFQVRSGEGGVSCSINMSVTAVRSGSRSWTREVFVNIALIRKLVDKLANTRQSSPPYMHFGMIAELPAFCDFICGTKR